MSFDVTPGRIFITDGPGGPIVFDTDQKLCHLLDDPIAGTTSERAALDWNGGLGAIPSPNGRDTDAFVANIPDVATHLVGLVRYDFSNSSFVMELPSGAWFVAGGTHILMHKTFQSSNGTFAGDAAVSSIAAITFYKSGSTIRVKDQVVLFDNRAEFVGWNFPAYTATYRLFPAAFS